MGGLSYISRQLPVGQLEDGPGLSRIMMPVILLQVINGVDDWAR